MKKFAVAVLCLLSLTPFTFAADTPAPNADATAAAHRDTKFLLNYLKQTRQDFLKSIKGLSEAQWNYKASPERWSIAECAEHITLAEDFIREQLEQKVLTAPKASSEDKAKVTKSDDDIITMMTDRSHKAQAPEPIQPKTHQWTTPQAIEKEFNARRDKTVQLAKSTPEQELRDHVAPSPAGFSMDGYQFLELLAGHTKRHTLQIEEVKATPGYPKK